MFYVYVLQSQTTGKIYIGQTNNLETRLERHNKELPASKRGYTTLNKGPWKIVYQEQYQTRQEVFKREKQLKSAKGRKFIKSVIDQNVSVAQG